MSHMQRATKGITKTQRERFLEMLRYRGLFSRIARELKLGPNGRSHVRRVALGERQSRRVECALRAELDRLEQEAA